MAAKNCETCGVKLTMLNTHLKYRKKCYPCGQKEFAHYKEERDRARAALAQQQPAQQPAKDFTQQHATKSMEAKEREEVIYATYLGGFAGVTKQNVEVDMHFKATQVNVETSFFGKNRKVLWTMPYNKIRDIRIDTAENLTAAR